MRQVAGESSDCQRETELYDSIWPLLLNFSLPFLNSLSTFTQSIEHYAL